MFDKLYLHQARDELIPKIRKLNPKVIMDETNRYQADIFTKGRSIQIILTSPNKKSVTVDIIDPFGIVRIPRKTFKKKEDFQVFLITDFSKLINEYYR
jgi:hypothetical protein